MEGKGGKGREICKMQVNGPVRQSDSGNEEQRKAERQKRKWLRKGNLWINAGDEHVSLGLGSLWTIPVLQSFSKIRMVDNIKQTNNTQTPQTTLFAVGNKEQLVSY